MGEQAIIRTPFSEFWALVDVIRWTDKRLYYRPVPGTYDRVPRETFCNIENVTVRNANPELFAYLRNLEQEHKDAKLKTLATMTREFKEAWHTHVEAGGGIVHGQGGISS